MVAVISTNADRIFQGPDSNWYFRVRGDEPRGSYASYDDAETALIRYTTARSPGCRLHSLSGALLLRWLRLRARRGHRLPPGATSPG
jgi:hypothetical protein